MLKSSVIILGFFLAACGGKLRDSSHTKSTDAIDSNKEEKQTTQVSPPVLKDTAVKTKAQVDTFSLSDIQGAWYDDPDDNGLFYIDDSIHYMEDQKGLPIRVSIDSLLIDFGNSTKAFRIYRANDTIWLRDLDDPGQKPLFRMK